MLFVLQRPAGGAATAWGAGFALLLTSFVASLAGAFVVGEATDTHGGRVESICPHFPEFFKRTAPAFRRCKNQPTVLVSPSSVAPQAARRPDGGRRGRAVDAARRRGGQD